MNIQFNIHYKTNPGDIIGIEYYTSGQSHKKEILLFYTFDGENWSGRLEISAHSTLKYNYVLIHNDKVVLREWGKTREVVLDSFELIIRDSWRARANVSNAFLTSAFTNAILKRIPKNKEAEKLKFKKGYHTIQFQFVSTSIEASLCYGITGNVPELGEWKKPVLMHDADFPLWNLSLLVDSKNQFVEYKYVIADPATGNIVHWEEGDNRILYTNILSDQKTLFRIYDDGFRHLSLWRGAGVAIPVFSLRSHTGMGIGEFTDLKLLTDWAENTGMKVIQVLPVNDTIATKTWRDSYPYAAISVFALHPLYIHIPGIASFKDTGTQQAYDADTTSLNAGHEVDFEKVLDVKFIYLKKLFDQEYDTFKKSETFKSFYKENEAWLPAYAAFSHLRDINKTVNYTLWPEYNTYAPESVAYLNSDQYEQFKEVEYYYFIQYHADKQLREARDYARSKGIALKGDLPIGIFRYSCDAWIEPALYNMDGQAGAPPDDFAVLGQNWGFPTYNWEEMAKDNYAWWQKRMRQLNRYFDILRIDHILGFFRIWEIPTDQIQGTMGLFNPRLPFSVKELEQYGLTGDLSGYTQPYITGDRVRRAFGSDTDDVIKTFFKSDKDGLYSFRTEVDTQVKVKTYLQKNQKYKKYENILLEMLADVILIEEKPGHPAGFNPRITLSTTYAYSQLDTATKNKLDRLYNDYYFVRHDSFWQNQALQKLPAILDASDMLICGEDLGMIPHSVPGVMRELNMLTLEIQRMPKGSTEFGIVQHYPYLSVCSPSSHDMPTIRGWWESDTEMAGRFFHNYLHWFGVPSDDCTPDIVKAIVDDHLSAPSMLAIFPIQDLIGMDGNLRNPYAGAEQINVPADPDHIWKFRFHMPVEQMLEIHSFNDMLRAMLKIHGR